MKEDKTAKVMDQNEQIARCLESEGYKLIKQNLYAKLRLLDSWMTLPHEWTQDQKLDEMEKRAGAISIVTELFAEAEGHANTAKAINEAKDEISKAPLYNYLP